MDIKTLIYRYLCRLSIMITRVEEDNLVLRLYCPVSIKPLKKYGFIKYNMISTDYCPICQSLMSTTDKPLDCCPCGHYESQEETIKIAQMIMNKSVEELEFKYAEQNNGD